MRDTFKKELAKFLSSYQRSALIGFDVTRYGITAPHDGVSIVDMPICEETIVGMAAGMSRVGTAVVVDLMFEAFIFRAFDALINQALLSFDIPQKKRAPLIVRAICGPFEGAGPQHSALAGDAIRGIGGWKIATPVCAEDVHQAFNSVSKADAPLLLLMPNDERQLESHLQISSDGVVRRTTNIGKIGLVTSSRLHSVIVDALNCTNLQDSFSIITTPIVQPFPWNALSEAVSDFEHIYWITLEQQVREETVRASHLRQLCKKPVDVIALCADGVSAYSASAIIGEIGQALKILAEQTTCASQAKLRVHYA